MAGKGDTFENDILGLVLNATPIANMADNAASSPLTSLYVSLTTAAPGESGSQTTNEISYTGYSRVAVLRNNSTPAWSIASGSATNIGAITFGAMTAGAGGTATHLVVGTAASGTGKVLYSGPINSGTGLAVSAGITPSVAASGCTVSED
jgi:hypothetical protein